MATKHARDWPPFAAIESPPPLKWSEGVLDEDGDSEGEDDDELFPWAEPRDEDLDFDPDEEDYEDYDEGYEDEDDEYDDDRG